MQDILKIIKIQIQDFLHETDISSLQISVQINLMFGLESISPLHLLSFHEIPFHTHQHWFTLQSNIFISISILFELLTATNPFF